MSLWNRIKGIVTQDADKYLYVAIPKEDTDVHYQDEPLKANRNYLRLWLSEMFLTKSREWFRDWHPAVHVSTQQRSGNSSPITLSRVVQAPEQAAANGVLLNYALTELLPFKGGTIEIEASLLALKGANYLSSAIQVLQDFSSLVSMPLAQALTIAEKVSNGMERLLDATNGQVHLPFHQTFTGAGGGGSNELKPGYLAVILATAAQVDVKRLQIKQDRLYYKSSTGRFSEPFRGYDYMLLRIEGRETRDDYRRLKSIEEPYNKFFDALSDGDMEEAANWKRATLIAAARSPDLTRADRRRVAMALKEELSDFENMGLGAIGGDEQDLNKVIATRAMSVDHAAALGEISLAELFDDNN